MGKPANSRRGSEGNAAFIGAAVAMLLMMGGLIYWKLGDKVPEPEQPSSSPSAAPVDTGEQVLEEAPPPPPEVEEEDAGGVELTAARGRKKMKKGGCDGPCKGKVTGTLQSALRARAGQARRCYERALRLNPTLKGRLTVNVTVGAAGQVCSASISNNTLGDASVSSCALGSFQGATLPPPQGGCVNTRVPVNFVPKP